MSHTLICAMLLLLFAAMARLTSGQYSTSSPGVWGNRGRTNFCNIGTVANPETLAFDVANRINGYTLMNALYGLNPSVATPSDLPPVMFTYDTFNMPSGGFLYNVLEAVANAGNFNFNYTMVGPQSGGLDHFLLYQSNRSDTVMRNVIDTVGRRGLGLSFTPPILDSTLVLIIDKNKANFIYADATLAWLLPFEFPLWGVIVTCIMVHAIVQYIMDASWQYKLKRKIAQAVDRGDEDVPEFPDDVTPPAFDVHAYESFSRFTGSDVDTKVYTFGKLQYINFTLFIMIVVASYTANLASVLISVPSSVNPIDSISDAVAKNARICFKNASISSEASIALAMYPNLVPVEGSGTNTRNAGPEVLDMLNAGKCDAAILGYYDWQYSSVQLSNKNCNLALAGTSTIKALGASFVYKSDYTTMCTSTFGDSFSAILSTLISDFTVGQLWLDAVSSSAQVDCSIVQTSPLSQAARLTPTQMQGIFIFFLVVAGIFFFSHMIGVCFNFPVQKAPSMSTCCSKKKSDGAGGGGGEESDKQTRKTLNLKRGSLGSGSSSADSDSGGGGEDLPPSHIPTAFAAANQATSV